MPCRTVYRPVPGRASTPQEQQLQLQQQHFILQQHRDSVDSTTSDMRVAESSSRLGSRESGVALQGGRRPRCRPTADVVPPAPGRMHCPPGDVMPAALGSMRGQPAEGSGSSSESESEAEYEDASDVWDTGSSVVSDKQYAEIEPREYHQHQGRHGTSRTGAALETIHSRRIIQRSTAAVMWMRM